MFGGVAEEIHEKQKQKATEVEVAELDEMWHFIKKKLLNFGYGLLLKEKQQK